MKVFEKKLPNAPAGFFAAEARGLQWLTVPGGPPTPTVIGWNDCRLVTAWIESAAPTRAAARSFGEALARLHTTGAPSYGADVDGFIGPLPLPNTRADDWPTFYAQCRLSPYADALNHAQRRLIERVCERLPELSGPLEPPARIHGDLWSGNLIWAADGQVWLVDAGAAHGGHRETDLAMLALFGAPHLDAIRDGYEEVTPLAPGWKQRIGLHQLHPLLVHATLFGGSYGERAAAIAQRLLAR
ncbi:MAG TPA: fructosamine kinase family protein [Mycobacteriales bacterium]|nr:fructosamine kinase family protein [Mycobacteriales bacterium]